MFVFKALLKAGFEEGFLNIVPPARRLEESRDFGFACCLLVECYFILCARLMFVTLRFF